MADRIVAQDDGVVAGVTTSGAITLNLAGAITDGYYIIAASKRNGGGLDTATVTPSGGSAANLTLLETRGTDGNTYVFGLAAGNLGANDYDFAVGTSGAAPTYIHFSMYIAEDMDQTETPISIDAVGTDTEPTATLDTSTLTAPVLIVDAMHSNGNTTPAIVAQTNRTEYHAAVQSGDCGGSSAVDLQPSTGSQVMNWTTASDAWSIVLVGFQANAAADTTAPTLSSPAAASTGATTGSGSVSTDEGNGTLYFVVTTSATGPSVAQVQAGQDHTGSAAVDSGSQAVSGTGSQSISGGFTGLTASTAYYAHYQHQDTATNDSTVSTSASFTTDAATTIVPVLVGQSNIVGSGPLVGAGPLVN